MSTLRAAPHVGAELPSGEQGVVCCRGCRGFVPHPAAAPRCIGHRLRIGQATRSSLALCGPCLGADDGTQRDESWQISQALKHLARPSTRSRSARGIPYAVSIASVVHHAGIGSFSSTCGTLKTLSYAPSSCVPPSALPPSPSPPLAHSCGAEMHWPSAVRALLQLAGPGKPAHGE